MRRLLREKEFRLSSRLYAPNDFLFPKKVSLPGCPDYTRDYPDPPPSHERFVHPDDANDVKAHKFFRGVPWDRLHLMQPPFIPNVTGWEDTRYFEEDVPISDVEDSPSTCSYCNHSSKSSLKSNHETSSASPKKDDNIEESHDKIYEIEADIEEIEDNIEAAHEKIGQTHDNIEESKDTKWNANEVPSPVDEQPQPQSTKPQQQEVVKEAHTMKSKLTRARKRARDKLLRDKDVGKQVMEIRKKSAFLGYTWRRSRTRPSGSENENILQSTADNNTKPKSRRRSILGMSF